MKTQSINLTGDTPGVCFGVEYVSFVGANKNAPSIYMQGALHADELPGPAVLHFLCEMLQQAEQEGRIEGNITIVPQANPIGTAQQVSGHMQGRFDLASRENFNRDFPLIALGEKEKRLENIEQKSTVNQLKAHLLSMALDHDMVIDLHCDDESLLYAYICQEFWPAFEDFAAAMDLQSVFLSDGQSTAFEEAVAYAFRHADDTQNNHSRFVTTLELRGQRDVSETMARADAKGLFSFLQMRGIVSGSPQSPKKWTGSATPLDHIEIVRAPVAGVILFHKDCGDAVKAGDVLATILTRPGDASGNVKITAPQDGEIITRIIPRFAARNQKLFKITCKAASQTKRPPGALEAR